MARTHESRAEATMTLNPESAVLRPWAAALLGAKQEDSPEQVRAAFFSKLAEAQFLPGQDVRAAAQIMLGKKDLPTPKYAATMQRMAQQLHEEIAAFAKVLWDLSLEERHDRYLALWKRADRLPIEESQLANLKNCLDVRTLPATTANSDVGRLAKEIESMCVLQPLERANRACQLLSRFWPDSRMYAAAKELRKKLPSHYSLQKDFVEELIAGPTEVSIVRVRKQSGRIGLAQVPANNESRRWGWVLLIFVMGLISLTSLIQNQHETTPYKLPPSLFHNETPGNPKDIWTEPSKESLEDFIKDREMRKKNGLPGQNRPWEW
jgi:hypothetical protein